MGYQDMKIRLNKEKSIGKVLFVVEGGKTESYILHRIFCKILDYQMETFLRDKGYDKYNSKENPTSQVFVINAEESNIKYIEKDNEYLNNLFRELIENLLSILGNSRDNGFERQGMLLLSYPSIEAFTLSNFVRESFEQKFSTGHKLKLHLHEYKFNQSNITEATLLQATEAMFESINDIGIEDVNVDAFGETNKDIFYYEENVYVKEKAYRALSLVTIALIDLGLLEIE